MNHHAAAFDDQVAGKRRTAWFVPEHEMIGRVPGRVKGRQRAASPFDAMTRYVLLPRPVMGPGLYASGKIGLNTRLL